MFGGAAASDAGGGFVAARDGLADTASGVFSGDALEMRVGEKELLALGESHGMRSNRSNVVERRSRAPDEVMFNGQDGFRDDAEIAIEQEIVNPHDGAGERVFHGNQKSIGGAIRDGPESRVKRGTGNSRDPVSEQLDGGGFTESAGFALKRDARGLAIGGAHGLALSCMKDRKTKSGESSLKKIIETNALRARLSNS